MREALLATAALLAGCAPAAAPMTAARCDAAKAQALVGQPGTSATAAQALKLSGAATLRWLQPGSMATMDYRADRLNIELDGQGTIKAIRCG